MKFIRVHAPQATETIGDHRKGSVTDLLAFDPIASNPNRSRQSIERAEASKSGLNEGGQRWPARLGIVQIRVSRVVRGHTPYVVARLVEWDPFDEPIQLHPLLSLSQRFTRLFPAL